LPGTELNRRQLLRASLCHTDRQHSPAPFCSIGEFDYRRSKLCTEPLRACHADRADRPLLLLLAKHLPIGLAVGIEANENSRSMAQVALAWLRHRAGNSYRRRTEAFAVAGRSRELHWALSAEQVKALDEASQIDPGFPFHLYAKRQVRHVEFFAGPACGLVAALELLREVIKTPLRSKALGR
jgi:hypothetical protein